MRATRDGGMDLYALAARNEFAPGFDQLGTVQAISAETAATDWLYERRTATRPSICRGGRNPGRNPGRRPVVPHRAPEPDALSRTGRLRRGSVPAAGERVAGAGVRAAAHLHEARGVPRGQIEYRFARLIELRDRWLNPPAWVKWVDESVPGYSKRTVPRNEDAAKALKKRTLTKSLQRPPAGGSPMCTTLDAAVAAAYGWSADIDDDHVLRELLALDSGGA